MTTLAIVDQARALVEALADSGNDGAARIVEQTVDYLEALVDRLSASEDAVEKLGARLQAFEELFTSLTRTCAAGERACNPDNRMVTLTVGYVG